MRMFILACVAILALSVTVRADQTAGTALDSVPEVVLLSDAEMADVQGAWGGPGSARDLIQYLQAGTPLTGYFFNWALTYTGLTPLQMLMLLPPPVL